MPNLLSPGIVVTTEAGRLSCRVVELLGKGSQGEVYRADVDGRQMALKWYLPVGIPSDQRDRLRALVRKGLPNERFLWPVDLVSDSRFSQFGYLMALREARYAEATNLVRTGGPRASTHDTVKACMQLAEAFHHLHANGLYYADVSLRNVFVDPKTGDVLVCDTDNVGEEGRTAPQVLGTPEFMAPEVMLRQAPPGRRSDLHSMAVLCFYLLIGSNPLQGRAEAATTFSDDRRVYGTHPLFTFDPDDPSNRPHPRYQPGAERAWSAYPKVLRTRFVEAFGVGLKDPSRRIPESLWLATFRKLSDVACDCASCGAQRFFDVDESGSQPCWSCNVAVARPALVFEFPNGIRVLLNPGRHLSARHVGYNGATRQDDTIAEVVSRPGRPQDVGLRNLGPASWKAQYPAGERLEVDPGRVARLYAGVRIQFGSREGQVVVR